MAAVAPAPLVVAHRGASSEAPENTLAAVRRAIARDADLVEVDVQRTRDGALVLLHDTTLARTTNVRRVFPRRAPWLVSDFTLDEITRLDAGSWHSPQFAGERIPTLEQLVDVLRPSSTGLLLELKAVALHPGMVRDVAATLRGVPGYADSAVASGRLVVQSFDHDAMKEHKRLEPGIPVGALGTPPRAELGAIATWADQVNPVYWSVRRSYVEMVHRHGMKCQLWTVNRTDQMRRALSLGVDGVITNHPGSLQTVLAEASSRLLGEPS
ncbi:MAG: Glycerophosphoryl diester phosphodiesterase [uncultured Nocardioidaceae bacterium]|uniref:Glycerophosphoryl diester phosphodiesterase n=1 Tax=uncultured Nocardioidaceae bacterium TaxID=253824 RepID=A0A6J4MJF1_9ACTN|nr:MAG: Glycerophosphoryl diester phosphodiesterase [uncultured Nocardioidaceae bacterium]